MKDTDPTHFLFWSGFTYTVDMSKPLNARVTDFELREDYCYRVVTTDYIYRHYRHLLSEAVVHQTFPSTMPELLVREIQAEQERQLVPQNMHIVSGPSL